MDGVVPFGYKGGRERSFIECFMDFGDGSVTWAALDTGNRRDALLGLDLAISIGDDGDCARTSRKISQGNNWWRFVTTICCDGFCPDSLIRRGFQGRHRCCMKGCQMG